MIALASLAVVVWAWLLLGWGRFWQAGPVLAAAGLVAGDPVVVVVPARDEAGVIGESVRSLLAQDYAGPLRVVVVDDGSADGTGTVARAIGDARLSVLTGSPRPAGWSGKLWAVAQGLEAAEGAAFVLLTDADIVHHPRHVSALVAQAERGDLDLVSEMVALRCRSWAERALVPAFVFFFQLL